MKHGGIGGNKEETRQNSRCGETGVRFWRSVLQVTVFGPRAWERVRFQLRVWELPGSCMFD